MDNNFNLLLKTRQNVLDFTSSFTIEELNIIPTNFNNNIIWNVGHLIATQQVLFYKLSGLDTSIYLEFIDRYRKGTKPEKFIGEEEWLFIRENLIKAVPSTYDDYTEKRFQGFKYYSTSYGAELNTIEDVISFNNVHEGVHFGFIKALAKAIGKH